jgi:hypothetical protein
VVLFAFGATGAEVSLVVVNQSMHVALEGSEGRLLHVEGIVDVPFDEEQGSRARGGTGAILLDYS